MSPWDLWPYGRVLEETRNGSSTVRRDPSLPPEEEPWLCSCQWLGNWRTVVSDGCMKVYHFVHKYQNIFWVLSKRKALRRFCGRSPRNSVVRNIKWTRPSVISMSFKTKADLRNHCLVGPHWKMTMLTAFKTVLQVGVGNVDFLWMRFFLSLFYEANRRKCRQSINYLSN